MRVLTRLPQEGRNDPFPALGVASRPRPRAERVVEAGRMGRADRLIPDDVVHVFAAVVAHREIAGAIEARQGGLTDAVFASISSTTPSNLPPDVLQDIRRIPTRFTGCRLSWS